jgi:hypothetical protein
MTILPTVRAQLYEAAAQVAREPHLRPLAGPLRPLARPRRTRRDGWGRTPLIAAAAVLVMVGAAFGAGLIGLGKPSPSTPVFSNPRAELGALTPGTVRLLPISTPDPAGGPAWGLRVLSTTRGVGCIQLGRLVGGRLGALGRDGSFHDDGRFHELPANGVFNQFSCAALDGRGRIFNNVTQGEQPASATWFDAGGCVPGGTPAYADVRRSPVCPQSDLRNVYYGLLGPEAKSVTYVLDGKSHTIPTAGATGAYLIVTRAPAHQLLGFPGATTADVVPVDGPITELHYRDGSTCHLNGKSWIGGSSACTPPLRVPVGYAPVPKPPSAAAVATRLRVRVVPASYRGHRLPGRQLAVSFVSRVAMRTDRSEYSMRVIEPHQPPGVYSGGPPANRDIAAGEKVTLLLQLPRGRSAHGVYRGWVTLVYATGPALLEGPGTVYVPVGQFTLRLP